MKKIKGTNIKCPTVTTYFYLTLRKYTKKSMATDYHQVQKESTVMTRINLKLTNHVKSQDRLKKQYRQ